MARYPDAAGYLEEQRQHPERVRSENGVFWSDDNDPDTGLSRNRQRAEQYAKAERDAGRSAATLENTEGGDRLDREKLFKDERFDKNEAYKVWLGCSRRYAESTSGEVNTFCCGSSKHSAFRTVEMEGLINNPDVKTINGLDRSELQKSHDPKNPDRTYYAIAEAELARDQRAHERGDHRFCLPDETPEETLKHRRELLATQKQAEAAHAAKREMVR